MSKRKKGKNSAIAIAVIIVLLIAAIVFLAIKIVSFVREDEERPVYSGTTTEITTTEVTTTQVTTTQTTTGWEATGENTSVTADTQQSEATVPSASDYDRTFFANSLFIGDSISTGFTLYQNAADNDEYLDYNNVFALTGLNPESALTTKIDDVTCIEKAAAMLPDNIYIMLGSNGISFMGNSYMLSCLKDLVGALETASPESKIRILSVPPVNTHGEQKYSVSNADIDAYNALLKDYCADEGLTYLDIATLLKDSSGYLSDTYAEADGMHFLGKTYAVVLHFLQESLS